MIDESVTFTPLNEDLKPYPVIGRAESARQLPAAEREALVEEVARAIQGIDEQNGSGSWDYYVSQGYKEYLDSQREKAEAALSVIEQKMGA